MNMTDFMTFSFVSPKLFDERTSLSYFLIFGSLHRRQDNRMCSLDGGPVLHRHVDVTIQDYTQTRVACSVQCSSGNLFALVALDCGGVALYDIRVWVCPLATVGVRHDKQGYQWSSSVHRNHAGKESWATKVTWWSTKQLIGAVRMYKQSSSRHTVLWVLQMQLYTQQSLTGQPSVAKHDLDRIWSINYETFLTCLYLDNQRRRVR